MKSKNNKTDLILWIIGIVSIFLFSVSELWNWPFVIKCIIMYSTVFAWYFHGYYDGLEMK